MTDEDRIVHDLCRFWREARRELDELRDLKVQDGAVDFSVSERVLTRELAALERVMRRHVAEGGRRSGK